MNSNELYQKSLKLVPGGVHSPVRSFKGLHTTPRFIKNSDGAYLTDEDGKEYIDFCMSFGPLILGHRNPKVETAIIDAVKRGWSYGACEKYSLELAEYIISRIPFIEQIRFMNSGTEAVMTALRLARGYTGKSKVIKFDGCYHGHLDSMLIKAGSGLAGTAEASSRGVTEETAKDTLICELGDEAAVKACFAAHHNQIAAIVIEPLPANNGLMPQSESFLKFLRKMATDNGALLIFDEVISGFRVQFDGYAGFSGIRPDILTYGKIIGGGMPVGAVAGPKAIMQELAPVGGVYQAGTLSANPVAMSAGLATLMQLTPQTYKQIETQSQKIQTLMTEWMKEFGFADYYMTRSGSLFWNHPDMASVSKISEIPKNLGTRFYQLFQTMLEKGIYLAPNAYEVGFVSLAHNNDVIEDLKNKLWN
ncbi:MAG: glutamate-1-semialdehyde 2,1-aminomutase [Bacteriovoracaceae bacterium]|nr:glutamate-1-semialdehyde 2,1-aminomutase [Bacteriovoracaceae bacterium]